LFKKELKKRIDILVKKNLAEEKEKIKSEKKRKLLEFAEQ
jgi:hypothetical protein